MNLIRRTITAAIMAAALLAGSAQAAQPSKAEQLAMRHCAQGRVISCIHRAALHWRIDYAQAKYIAWRESRNRPTVCNPQPVSDGEHACGLFQFLGSTWASTPYGRRGLSLYSAKWSALGYAWEIAHGGSSNWGF